MFWIFYGLEFIVNFLSHRGIILFDKRICRDKILSVFARVVAGSLLTKTYKRLFFSWQREITYSTAARFSDSKNSYPLPINVTVFCRGDGKIWSLRFPTFHLPRNDKTALEIPRSWCTFSFSTLSRHVGVGVCGYGCGWEWRVEKLIAMIVKRACRAVTTSMDGVSGTLAITRTYLPYCRQGWQRWRRLADYASSTV